MLHQNIKALRQQQSLSQQDLAEQLHVVRQTVSKWETGLSVPDAQQLLKLAELFDVPVAQLLDQPLEDTDTDTLRQQLQQLEAQLTHLQKKRRRNRCAAAILLLILSLIPLAATALPLIKRSFSIPVNAIGGVDGPTSIFVTVSQYHPNWLFPMIWFLLFAGLGIWLLHNKKT